MKLILNDKFGRNVTQKVHTYELLYDLAYECLYD